MSPSKLLLIVLWTAFSIADGVVVVRSFWRLRSSWQRWRAGERSLRSARAVIWRDPGPVDQLDLEAGPGGPDGAPKPPFSFVEEHLTGSHPCVSLRDANGRTWRAKWGSEVHTETFCTRLAWAAGYFVEITYFVAAGHVEGAENLQRAKDCLDASGQFCNARFELDEPGVIKHFDQHSWAWNDNPFVGTPELNGLKILMMLLANWDNKDVRDVARGSNTAIFEYRIDKHQREARYLIIDWGAALGAWGGNILSRGRWNAEAFAAQTDQLITGVDGPAVSWGYSGQRTADAVDGISVADVGWLHQRLAPLTDAQLSGALRASGATAEEAAAFTTALRRRIDKLASVAQGAR
jgi:hypothetical protein